MDLVLDVTSVTALLLAAGAARRTARGGGGGGGGGGGSSSSLSGGGSSGGSSSGRAGRGGGGGSSGSSGSGSSGTGVRGAGGEGTGAAGDGELGLGQVGALGDLGGTRDLVGGQGLVDIDEDTGVALRVEGLTQGAGRGQGTGAGHGQVEALGVVLGTVRLLSAVQGDDLVAPDVVARLEVRRDLDEPRVVVGDQEVRPPGTREDGIVDQTDAADVEELERGLVDGGAVAIVTLGQHVDDGAFVGTRPGGPVDLDVVAGLDRGVPTGVGGILVADDVAAGVGVRGDVTVVCVVGGPAYADWGVRLVSVFGRKIKLVSILYSILIFIFFFSFF